MASSDPLTRGSDSAAQVRPPSRVASTTGRVYPGPLVPVDCASATKHTPAAGQLTEVATSGQVRWAGWSRQVTPPSDVVIEAPVSLMNMQLSAEPQDSSTMLVAGERLQESAQVRPPLADRRADSPPSVSVPVGASPMHRPPGSQRRYHSPGGAPV